MPRITDIKVNSVETLMGFECSQSVCLSAVHYESGRERVILLEGAASFYFLFN